MLNIHAFLQKTKTDAFLISQFYNILYATGFETLSPMEREAYVLVTREQMYVITDSRYERGTVDETIEFSLIEAGKSAVDMISQLCKKHGIKTFGYEADNLTGNEIARLAKLGVQLYPHSNALSHLRAIKSEEEIFAIKQACHIGDLVLKDITPYIHPGQTEKEIAWYIERSIREGYSAEVAFDPIVAVDANSAIPHYNTKKGSGVVGEASLLLLDFGVKQHNYCSDITRMVAVGNVTQEILTTYDELLAAEQKTIAFLTTAKRLGEVDGFCRGELSRNKQPNYLHSTGHGIGLEVHESPRVSGISQDMKQPGQVFTIEPGVYHPGKWGMRIEDTVAISPQGEVEVLTRFPRELILL